MATDAILADRLARTFTVGRRKQAKTVDAVSDLTFSVQPGERVAFIGPNGAGKSTSMKMLTGILFPTGGTARVLGLTPWEDRTTLALRIGTLFGQRSQLWSELKPRVSLGVLGAIFGLSDKQTRDRLAALGDLLEAGDLFDQPIRTQSLGQRMRCELAACMLHEPELLFLDEPTIGLDLLGKQVFREQLVRLNEELGTTVFLTSHDVADIESVAERAIVVNHGTVIYDDTVDAMRRQLLATKRIEIGLERALPEPVERNGSSGGGVLAPQPGVVVHRRGSLAIEIEVDTAVTPLRTVLDEVLADLAVTDLSITDPPLESVIGEIYQRPRQ